MNPFLGGELSFVFKICLIIRIARKVSVVGQYTYHTGMDACASFESVEGPLFQFAHTLC